MTSEQMSKTVKSIMSVINFRNCSGIHIEEKRSQNYFFKNAKIFLLMSKCQYIVEILSTKEKKKQILRLYKEITEFFEPKKNKSLIFSTDKITDKI